MILLVLGLIASRTAEAVFISEPLCIDGMLDEACWQENPGITDFVEHYPDRGAEPVDSTRIIICYDHNYLYFGCFCFQNPDSTTARLVPRESYGDGDDVTISLDTYDDDRNAFQFSINPLGIQRDIHLTRGGGTQDITWNGVWYSEAKRTSWGWSGEVVIPWRTLRFKPKEEQVWGLQISRWINYRYQTLMWADYTKDDVGTRVDRFGTLTGIKGVKPGLNIELLPHLTQTARLRTPELLDSTSFLSLDNGVAGLDLKWGILSNLTLDVTTFPDYGQIEADPEQINLSRFEAYLDERRSFFTEGADLFDLPYFDAVYTRRIGGKLADGSEVPIYAGTKLTGKLGKTSLGFIEVYTGKKNYTDWYGEEQLQSSALYSIARVKQDVFSRSEIGVIATSREQFSDSLSGDRIAGADFRVHFPWEFFLTGCGLYSFHTDKQGGSAGMLRLGRSGKYSFEIEGTYTDSAIDFNAVGYQTRSGHMSAGADAGYTDSWGKGVMRSLSISVGPAMGKYLEDSIMSYTLWGYAAGNFANNWYSSIYASVSHNYYQEDGSLRWITYLSTGFSTPHTQVVYGGLWLYLEDRYIYYNLEPQYFGHLAYLCPSLSIRPHHNLLSTFYGTSILTFTESWEPDPTRVFSWTSGFSLLYTATRHLSFRLNAQQNTDAERYNQQFLITWEIAPLSYLYLASSVNLTGDTETRGPFDVEVSEVTFYGKIVYLFRI